MRIYCIDKNAGLRDGAYSLNPNKTRLGLWCDLAEMQASTEALQARVGCGHYPFNWSPHVGFDFAPLPAIAIR